MCWNAVRFVSDIEEIADGGYIEKVANYSID